MSEPKYPVKLMLQRYADFLDQAIMPELTDSVKLQKTLLVSSSLRILANSLDQNANELIAENTGMRTVLENVCVELKNNESLSQNPKRNELLEKLDSILENEKQANSDPSRENDELRGAMVDAIIGLDALTEDMPEDAMAGLKQQIRASIRQQLDYGLGHLEGVPLAY